MAFRVSSGSSTGTGNSSQNYNELLQRAAAPQPPVVAARVVAGEEGNSQGAFPAMPVVKVTVVRAAVAEGNLRVPAAPPPMPFVSQQTHEALQSQIMRLQQTHEALLIEYNRLAMRINEIQANHVEHSRGDLSRIFELVREISGREREISQLETVIWGMRRIIIQLTEERSRQNLALQVLATQNALFRQALLHNQLPN